MNTSSTQISSREVEKQFVLLASELSNYFPALDLRFNLLSGTTQLRCIAPEISPVPLNLDLSMKDTTQLLYEAIFAIKMLGKFFDA